MNKRVIPILLSIAGLATGGALALRYRANTPTLAQKSSTTGRLQAVCNVGKVPFAYSVALTNTMAFRMADMPGMDPQSTAADARNMEVPLQARMTLTPLAERAGRRILAARFDQLSGTGADLEGLGAPFLFELNDHCEVRGFARSKGSEKERARQAQAVLHEMHARIAEPGTERSTGKDAQGEYTQEYITTRNASAIDVAISGRTYSRVWIGDMPTQATMQGQASFGVGPWLSSLSTERTFATAGVVQKYQMTVTRTERDTSTKTSLDENDYVWEDLLSSPSILQSRGEPTIEDAERIRTLPAEQAKAEYVAQFSSQAHIGAAGTFLRNYVEAHPSFAKEILREVQAGHLEGMQAAAVFPALQIARTVEARNALTELRESGDIAPWTRMQTTVALASRSDVTASMTQAFAREAAVVGGDPVSSFESEQSMLALGLVISHAAKPEVITLAKESLMSFARSIEGGERFRGVVGAIANSGDVDFLPKVVQWSKSGEQEVRYKAAEAFRKMPIEKTTDAQIAWLSGETDLRVKAALIDTVWKQAYDQERGFATTKMLAAAQHEVEKRPDNFDLRLALVRVMGEAAKKGDNEMSKALGHMYATEPNLDIRVVIGHYVHGEFLEPRTAQ